MTKFILAILFLNPVFAVFSGFNGEFFPAGAGVFSVLAQKMSAPAPQSAAKTQRQNYLSLLNLSDFAVLPADKTNIVPEPAPENPAPIRKEEIQTEPAAEISRDEISQLMIYPARNFNVLDIEINAKSYLLYDAERDLILYSKNIEEKMFIASLTKLMTAMVGLDNAAPEEIAFVSQNAVRTEEEMGNLVVAEKISVKNLLHALLIESSNDAATALAEHIENKTAVLSADEAENESGRLKFVELMNKKAAALGLKNTRFTTPSGLNGNYSTALDLVRLAKASFDYPLIWEIMKKPSADVYSEDKKIIHHFANSNKLLVRFPNILGGKTGYTKEAGECMILVHEIKQGQKNIFIILNAKDRTAEMAKFIQWSLEAFLW